MAENDKKRILIQACSQRKINATAPVAAEELYDGTAFRVVRKYLREKELREPDFKWLILSAEYGLIEAGKLIAPYDRKMDQRRAAALQSDAKRVWESIADRRGGDIFVNLGKLYLPALELIVFPAGARYAAGGIGTRNGQLKRWLNGEL